MVPPPDPIAALRDALRGRYEFEREIGQGAYATVYLAQDLKHERKVAIKVLHADPTSETGELRFIREIRLLARLQHPNILPLHDSGHVETVLYYVMPYVGGESLRDRIDREHQLPADTACSIARDVADALVCAHSQGIIHRDIKPENILLSAGHPVLADFGIARVIDLAGVKQVTRTGMGSPGTPAYMSPEQLMGDKVLDQRSDTYSLGCVLFEMLAGKPPFSGKEGFVKRFTEPAPKPSAIRPDLPTWLDGVVTTALAKNPSERYQTAEEFVAALTVQRKPIPDTLASAQQPSDAPALPEREMSKLLDPDATHFRPVIDVRGALAEKSKEASRSRWLTSIRQHKKLTAALGAAVLAAALFATDGTASLRNAIFATKLDTTRIALLPFSGTGPRPDRDHLTSGFYAALSEWQGLNLASDQDVADLVRSRGSPASTRAAAALARRLGAAHFIWGQIDSDDPSQSRAQLYDATSGLALKSTKLAGTPDRAALARAVRELLKAPSRPPAADGGDGRTASYPAWLAYAQGHIALRNGDFETAEKNFREAATDDPEFGPARVWLAQVRAWIRPSGRQEWRDEVTQGIHAKGGLSEKDVLVALALSNLATKRYPEACASYARIVSVDSLNFTGWYGSGQCRALDSLVIPSVSSPSRWRFRSRYSEAASAFMKAVSVNPAAHSILSFDQMQVLLPIASTLTRRGMSASGEEFAAYPALIHDTVVFVPYPLQDFSRLSARQTAAQQSAALSRNLDVLLEFTTQWTRDAPRSAGAYQALADVLEARGEIANVRSADMSAIQAVNKARELATTPHEQLVAATSAGWLLFKQGEFASARILADSILFISRKVNAQDALTTIGLAALTGKVAKTSELARVTVPYGAGASTLPIPVMDAAAPFFAFASLGVCGDTIKRLEKHLDDQIAHYVAEDDQPQVSATVKARALGMLASCTGGKASLGVPASTRILSMQQALAKGESGALRRMLGSTAADARAQRPGDIALDFAYQAAWLRAESGDTAGAARQLDRTLGGLPSMSAAAVREPASAAAAGRAMALRAELAAARGETAERQKWARALVDLWATADAPLQPLVARMRSLAAPNWSR